MIEHLLAKPPSLDDLEQIARAQLATIPELFRRHVDGEQKIVDFFERLRENAIAMKTALEREEVGRVAEALNEDWRVRKAMLPTMTTPDIERLTTEASKRGALAARVCGAGGGGCVVLLIEPDERSALTRLIERMGMQVLPATISPKGVSIEAD